MRTPKYGVTKHHVLGLEVVTATGEIIRTGGKTVKNVVGFDLTGLMCGSEGMLGIITEATLETAANARSDIDRAGKFSFDGSGVQGADQVHAARACCRWRWR